MALFTESQVKAAATDYYIRDSIRADSVGKMLAEDAKATSPTREFDVFLSHSLKDTDTVVGVREILKAHGLSSYVDWIVDPHLDREKVTSSTAETLRHRMRQCRSLLFVHSANSRDSKWMPWELGYFDAFRGTVGVFPITKQTEYSFVGQEYLGIYPYVDQAAIAGSDKKVLWINKATNEYAQFSNWILKKSQIAKRS